MTDPLMHTYNPLPVSFSHGQGAWLWDAAGNQYLDALAGIAVTVLGHTHPAVTAVIHDQADKLLHTSNLYQIDHQIALGDKLCALSGMTQAFFANSGAEANECAIKLCRLYGHQKNFTNPHIIVMEKAFHGRTLATLSATGNRKVQAGFEPLVQGFLRAPYNDIPALKTIANNCHDIVAVMLEPIQGEGGVYIPDQDYLQQVRQICDENDWLLVIDEVQTGMGRTGTLYAYQQTPGLLPDILTTAKGLANGIPIGACLAAKKAVDLFHPGNHGSTFGGNPFSTRVGLTVLETLIQQKIPENALKTGNIILEELKKQLQSVPEVLAIRGQGLMIGIEMDHPCRDILMTALKHRILFSVTADTVIRLLPPLIITDSEAREIALRVSQTIKEWCDLKRANKD